jgi:hypothetical protein
LAHTALDRVAEYSPQKANRSGCRCFAATHTSKSSLFCAFRVASCLTAGNVVHEIIDVIGRNGSDLKLAQEGLDVALNAPPIDF